MRLRICSGRPCAQKRAPSHPSGSRFNSHSASARPTSRRQVSARVASIFVTPDNDSIDADVESHPSQHRNPYDYPAGYSLFKVKRTKKAHVTDDTCIEDIREKEFLTSHKTGSHHISIYTSNFEESVEFYTKGLGLKMSPWRPNGLPYNGAWFNVPAVGHDDNVMIHLIDLPNPLDFSRCHDESCIAHFSIAIEPGSGLKAFHERMDKHGYRYYKSVNERDAALFCDPNGYRFEVVEVPQE